MMGIAVVGPRLGRPLAEEEPADGLLRGTVPRNSNKLVQVSQDPAIPPPHRSTSQDREQRVLPLPQSLATHRLTFHPLRVILDELLLPTRQRFSQPIRHRQ